VKDKRKKKWIIFITPINQLSNGFKINTNKKLVKQWRETQEKKVKNDLQFHAQWFWQIRQKLKL